MPTVVRPAKKFSPLPFDSAPVALSYSVLSRDEITVITSALAMGATAETIRAARTRRIVNLTSRQNRDS